MSDEAERFEELATGIVAPLILGGKLVLARPFGRLGQTLGQGRRLADVELRTRMEVARVRRARLVAPVDTLPELDVSDWAIAAMLNDILQLTNHELGGALTQGRYAKLLRSVLSGCAQIALPHDLASVISRHATFARVMELGRADTSVSWWTGHASFRGMPPPTRLLLWRDLRKVQVDTVRVPLHEMAEGMPALVSEGFGHAISAWLSCSPLTDLASLTRESPAFAWSRSTIALIATVPGRVLAFRVLSRLRLEAVMAALERARVSLFVGFEPHRGVLEEFSREAREGLEALRGKQEKPRTR